MTDPPHPTMLCAICARALIKYKRWHDWSGRATHYTCYKRANRELSMQMMLEDWRNAHLKKNNYITVE